MNELCTKCGKNPPLENQTKTCKECEERALDALLVAAMRGIDPFKALGLDTGETVPVKVGNDKRYGLCCAHCGHDVPREPDFPDPDMAFCNDACRKAYQEHYRE